MRNNLSLLTLWCVAISLFMSVSAQASSDLANRVITGYGNVSQVADMIPLPADATFKVAFDITAQGDIGKVNRKLNSLARFINMHVANGIKLENIHLAAVVHGNATFDLLNNVAYNEKFDTDNPNVDLVRQLLANNTQVFLCGQASTGRSVTKEQLIPGVQKALSAMTMHALLQQQGYTLNP